jgi:hypothetical protein
VQAPDHDRVHAAADSAFLLDLGDRADPGVSPVDPGNENDFSVRGRSPGLGLRRLDRERHDHAGEDDAGRQRKQGRVSV